ncbi:MAG: hypothetical protein HY683_01890 [Chloroflexi bacterium]|nr:hypothetical protein [Chloroflexota bacterium]
MENEEFLRRAQQRIEQSTGKAIELAVQQDQPRSVKIDFSTAVPKVYFGADALVYPGMARMFIQYAILSLREGRRISEEEFLHFLRRN